MRTETVHITASHIVYLLVCHRKLWLFANGVEMEHFSESILEGRLLHEISYPRRPSQYVEVQIEGIKIDFFDPRTHTVHETKRGRSMQDAHRAQVQYYLYKLYQHGVTDASGIIEYPDLRKTEQVAPLQKADLQEIAGWEQAVLQLMAQDTCPPVINKPFCKQCSYHDLCYMDEV